MGWGLGGWVGDWVGEWVGGRVDGGDDPWCVERNFESSNNLCFSFKQISLK